MKISSATPLTLALLALAMPKPAFAAKFQGMKPGEWKSEVIESSLGPAGRLIEPRTQCISEEDVKRDWDAVIKDEFKKTSMDCQLDKQKEETSSIAYSISCKGTEASKGKKNSLPPGATFEGTVSVVRESDNAFLLDTDSKLKGYKLPEADLAKIPAEQRQMVAAALAMQAGDIRMKMKQRYTFVKAGCVKKDSSVKATVEPAKPEAPAKK